MATTRLPRHPTLTSSPPPHPPLFLPHPPHTHTSPSPHPPRTLPAQERWAEEFSLAREQAAQLERDAAAARQVEVSRLAAEAAERTLLEAEWRDVRKEIKGLAVSVPAPCERFLQLHHKQLKGLLADFAAAPTAVQGEATNAPAPITPAPITETAHVPTTPPTQLSLRGWSLLTKLAGLVQPEHGCSRAQLGALFSAAAAPVPPEPSAAASAENTEAVAPEVPGAEAAGAEVAPPAPDTTVPNTTAGVSFEPVSLSLAGTCGLLVSLAAGMAAGDAGKLASQLEALLKNKLLPLAAAAGEFPGWAHHQHPTSWPPPDSQSGEAKRDESTPPWGDDGGNTARGGTAWRSLDKRREQLQAPPLRPPDTPVAPRVPPCTTCTPLPCAPCCSPLYARCPPYTSCRHSTPRTSRRNWPR